MKKIINWLAYISLTVAFVVGYVIENDSHALDNLRLVAENDLTLKDSEHGVYKAYKGHELYGYIAVGESQGYGGPMKCAVLSDLDGKLIGAEILRTFDTNSFIAKLTNKRYYDQYEGKSIGDKFDLRTDIQAISGATVSSRAVANASREASHRIAENIIHQPVEEYVREWKVSEKEGIILGIFLLGIFAILYKKKKLIYFAQFLGLVFVGFVFNESLTVTHFGRIILGYFPDIHTHLTWWILISGTILVIIVFGKNVYCNSVCPFRATQILLNKISGINLKLSSGVSKVLVKTPMVLLWLSLMLIFISANPTVSSYEPFAMLFSLKGHGIQWYILPTSLIGALFFSNFFCRFFCPVGGVLGWMVRRRNQVVQLIKRIN